MIKKVTLGELASISSAGDKPDDFSPVKTEVFCIPVIANGIDNDGIIGYTTSAKIEKEAVTVSARGNVGSAYYRCEPYYPVIRLLSLLPNEDVDCKYLYYLLLNSPLKGIGSVQAQLTVPDVSNMEVFYEDDYDSQKTIATSLSLIDDKIANNGSIISDLENMARLLYDYWFVQFDFPNGNGKPYKSSGGKMIWSDLLNREIPEGWETKRLSDLTSFVNDRINNDELTQETYIGTDNLLPDMKGRTNSEYVPTTGSSTGFLPKDILIANIRPYFKKIWYSDIEGGCSADVLAIRGNNTDLSLFIHRTLARDDFFSYDMAGSKGSKMPRGDKDHIMNYPIPFNQVLAVKYCKCIGEWQEKIMSLYYENQTLAALRDYLLPVLMNGQVKVNV